MDKYLHTLNESSLTSLQNYQHPLISSLESGKVVHLSHYSFDLTEEEHKLLSESILDKKHKNISYDHGKHKLGGLAPDTSLDTTVTTLQFMERFAAFSKELVDTLLPKYRQDLKWGRTSYRPVEIRGRTRSKRQDDTRLHVDSFSATPVQGLRILRVFCNINPNGQPRIWHLGEPFSDVLNQFSHKMPRFSYVRAKLLQFIRATKSLRSPYDHFMLNLHDNMKLDDSYQQAVPKHRVDFPPQSTWLVFTDQVSHAALSGQFLLEQTFYLPVPAMDSPDLSPLKQWETQKGCSML